MAARQPARPWASAQIPQGITVLGEPHGRIGMALGNGQRGGGAGQAVWVSRQYSDGLS